MTQEWKYICTNLYKKYDYYVNCVGDFKRVKTILNRKKEVLGVIEENIPLKFNKQNGYYSVNISGKTYYVHRLVALYFHPSTYVEGYQVNHIDGDKSNNNYKNLEWVTGKENMEHASKHGLLNTDSEKRKIQCVKNVKNSYEVNKKPIVKLDDNGNVIEKYDSIKEAIELNNIRGGLTRALKQNYRAHGYRWMYYSDYLNNKHLDLKPIKNQHGSKQVFQQTENGEIVNRFNSITEAEEYARKLREKIGKKKTHRGSFKNAIKNNEKYLGYFWVVSKR